MPNINHHGIIKPYHGTTEMIFNHGIGIKKGLKGLLISRLNKLYFYLNNISLKWTALTDNVIQNIAVDKKRGRVFAVDGSKLYCFNLLDGSKIWEFAVAGVSVVDVSIKNACVIVNSSADQRIYKFDYAGNKGAESFSYSYTLDSLVVDDRTNSIFFTRNVTSGSIVRRYRLAIDTFAMINSASDTIGNYGLSVRKDGNVVLAFEKSIVRTKNINDLSTLQSLVWYNDSFKTIMPSSVDEDGMLFWLKKSYSSPYYFTHLNKLDTENGGNVFSVLVKTETSSMDGDVTFDDKFVYVLSSSGSEGVLVYDKQGNFIRSMQLPSTTSGGKIVSLDENKYNIKGGIL